MNRLQSPYRVISCALLFGAVLIPHSKPLLAQTSWALVSQRNLDANAVLFDSTTSSLVAGTQQGIHRSTDNGDSWTLVSRIQVTRAAWVLAGDGRGSIYGGSYGHAFVRSRDGGATWALNIDDTLMNRLGWVKSVGIDGQGSVFVGTTAGAFRSTDAGGTWELKSSGLPQGIPDLQAFALNTTGSFFTVTGGIIGASVYRTVDDGESWELMAQGRQEDYIGEMIATPNGTLISYVHGTGLIRSEDDGRTFGVVDLGLGATGDVKAFALSGRWVYAATNPLGLQRSSDEGITWEQVATTGLPASGFQGLAALPGGALIAATDSGLYRQQSVASVDASEIPVADLQAWPNPATDLITVSYASSTGGSLEVVDPLGHVIVMKEIAGSGRTAINVRELPAGVYLVRMRNAHGSATRRIAVVR